MSKVRLPAIMTLSNCRPFSRIFGLCLCLLALSVPSVSAQVQESEAVSKVLSSALVLDGQDAVIQALIAGAGRQKLPADKKRILAVLADYEERLSLNLAAASHYKEAALADPAGRDDSLLLSAARCLLAANETSEADGVVRAVLLTSFDDKLLLRARVYSAWIQLSSGDLAGALPLLRSYAQNTAFNEYAPSLLFTLWWSADDQNAKTRLLTQYPLSLEASVVRGEISLAPAPFWYLMPKNEERVASFARDGNAALKPVESVLDKPVSTLDAPTAPVSTPVAESGTLWQQVGFFRNREYADELAGLLRKKGFEPVIRSEKRPSGTVYLMVLVAETEARTVGPRLKDAGFESFLLVE